MDLLKKALTILENGVSEEFSGEYCLSMRLEVGDFQVSLCTVGNRAMDGRLLLEVACLLEARRLHWAQ